MICDFKCDITHYVIYVNFIFKDKLVTLSNITIKFDEMLVKVCIYKKNLAFFQICV